MPTAEVERYCSAVFFHPAVVPLGAYITERTADMTVLPT